jgi:hypothetical protein
MRRYWGGMLDEGATSFWEAYDPHWPKQDFHAALEADNKRGYYVSLAHGWASGPTAWLMSEILGIQPTGPGFAEVTIRPDLADLTFARGAEPTPHGLLRVDATPATITIDLPPATIARLSLPFAPTQPVRQNGRPIHPQPDNNRSLIRLDQPGHYIFTGASR